MVDPYQLLILHPPPSHNPPTPPTHRPSPTFVLTARPQLIWDRPCVISSSTASSVKWPYSPSPRLMQVLLYRAHSPWRKLWPVPNVPKCENWAYHLKSLLKIIKCLKLNNSSGLYKYSNNWLSLLTCRTHPHCCLHCHLCWAVLEPRSKYSHAHILKSLMYLEHFGKNTLLRSFPFCNAYIGYIDTVSRSRRVPFLSAVLLCHSYYGFVLYRYWYRLRTGRTE